MRHKNARKLTQETMRNEIDRIEKQFEKETPVDDLDE